MKIPNKILLSIATLCFVFGTAQQALANEDLSTNELAAPTESSAETSISAETIDSQLATSPLKEYYRAKVIKIIDEGTRKVFDREQEYQVIKLKILNGAEKGQEITITQVAILEADKNKKVYEGEVLVLVKTNAPDRVIYHIADKYRGAPMMMILAIFVGFVVLLSRWKGITSILGLLFSILVLTYFIVPQIFAGQNPFLISVAGSLIIISISLFLAHGWNTRTQIAFVSTVLTLGLAAILAYFFTSFAKLYGMGSEEAVYLQLSATNAFNLKGLLLGGIMIGTLGVLDDITTAQVATVHELAKANAKLNLKQLYTHGISVGREHIVSLVNTLVLAYAGASLPLFLLFTANSGNQPLWVLLNSEFVAEEVIRTLVGSTALILAVPIATFFAAYWFGDEKRKATATGSHSHNHHH